MSSVINLYVIVCDWCHFYGFVLFINVSLLQGIKGKSYHHFGEENLQTKHVQAGGFAIPNSAAQPAFAIHVDDSAPATSTISLSEPEIAEIPLASAVTTLQRPELEVENTGPFIIEDGKS